MVVAKMTITCQTSDYHCEVLFFVFLHFIYWPKIVDSCFLQSALVTAKRSG